MRVIVSATLDNFWINVFARMTTIAEWNVAYWIGENQGGIPPAGAFYHDVWDAFLLKNLDQVNYSQLDISDVSRQDYYNYIKILDRVDVDGCFTFSERDHFFKKQLDYWMAVIKKIKPDLVFFSNAPHLIYDYPLYIAAKLSGIRMFMMHVTPFPGWHYGGYDIGHIVETPFIQKGVSDLPDKKDIIQPFLYSIPENLWYMEKQRKYETKARRIKIMILNSWLGFPAMVLSWLLMRFIRRKKSDLKDGRSIYLLKSSNHHLYGDHLPGKLYRIAVEAKFRKKKKKIKKLMESSVDKNFSLEDGRFFYFPLHYQPEQTTVPLGGYFSDQIYLIREISKVMPVDCKLVVKEHPSQFTLGLAGHFGRYPGFWKELSSLDKVILVSPSISSRKLIEKTIAVFTITGTAGWEAIVSGKPCIYFGKAWYSRFPQAIQGDISNLAATVSDLAQGRKVIPDFDDASLNSSFFDFAIKCDIHGTHNDISVSRDSEKMVAYLRQYCFLSSCDIQRGN